MEVDVFKAVKKSKSQRLGLGCIIWYKWLTVLDAVWLSCLYVDHYPDRYRYIIPLTSKYPLSVICYPVIAVICSSVNH